MLKLIGIGKDFLEFIEVDIDLLDRVLRIFQNLHYSVVILGILHLVDPFLNHNEAVVNNLDLIFVQFLFLHEQARPELILGL